MSKIDVSLFDISGKILLDVHTSFRHVYFPSRTLSHSHGLKRLAFAPMMQKCIKFSSTYFIFNKAVRPDVKQF